MMFFGHLLEKPHREEILQSYIEYFRDGCDCIENIDPTGQPNGRRFARGLGLAVYEAAATYLEENKDLLLSDDKAGAETNVAEVTGDAA